MKPKRRVKADGWAELLARPQPDGSTEFTLTCAHSAAKSETILTHFSQDLALGLALHHRATMPWNVSNVVIQICVLRTLLGRLLTEETGCECGLLPFEVAELVELDPASGEGS